MDEENLLRDHDSHYMNTSTSEHTPSLRMMSNVLNSAPFWILVILLVLLDLCIYSWQAFYSPDSRLESLEAFISGIFMIEIVLRIYLNELNPKNCLQVFDAVIVLMSFILALTAVNSPLMIGRAARLVMVLRGGTRMSRVSRGLQPITISASQARTTGKIAQVYFKPSPHLAKFVASLLDSTTVPVAQKDILAACWGNSFKVSGHHGSNHRGSSSKSGRRGGELLLSVAAIEVVRQYCKSPDVTFQELMNGTKPVFPENSL